MSWIDDSLRALAADQWGAVARWQAADREIPLHAIDRRVRSGALIPELHGTYSLSGTPRSRNRDLMVAALWGGRGAILWGRTAAEVWELRVPPATEIHVLARRVKHRVPPHVKARFTDKLPDLHRATVKGLPVASVERTLIALAAELPRLRAEIALDDALRRSLTSPRRIDACIAAISARGRRGTGIMRELLAPRMSNGIPESPLESKFYSALLSSDVPMPRLQFEVRVAGNLYRLDFAWPTKRVAVEMDGYAYHHGKVEWERDLARRNALTAIDWKLLHGRWDEDPYALLEKVRPLVT